MTRKWLKLTFFSMLMVLMAAFAWNAVAQEDSNQQQDQNTQTSPMENTQTSTGNQDMGTMHHHDMGNMQMGQNADYVRSVQQALQSNGQDPGPVDGHMGPKTKAAIRAYQKANGLRVTGTIDQETAQKLGIQTSSTSQK